MSAEANAMLRLVLLSVGLFSAASHAQQWQPSLATTASLRTGKAELVTSDALDLGTGRIALITYWELRTTDDLDVYRCIDIVDSQFASERQECWRVLRPSGRPK
jgi:hypothetical protein